MSNLHFEQRETLAIIDVDALKSFLNDKFNQFILNYRNAIAYYNNSLIIKCCDLLTLLINFKTDSFTTYYQEKQ